MTGVQTCALPIYPTSNSGDLTVKVKEADGSEQTFIQPFSSVAIFQREGHLKYTLSGGEYRAYRLPLRTSSLSEETNTN